MKQAFTYCLTLAFVLVFPQVVNSTTLSTAASALGHGEWVKLGTYSDLVTVAADKEGWNNFEYSYRLFWIRTGDLGTGKLVHLGSGHCESCGTWHLIEYSEATNSWSKTSAADLDCHIHSYQLWATTPSNGYLYSLCPSDSPNDFQVWNGSTWVSLDDWPGGYSALLATAYFPDRGKIYAGDCFGDSNDSLKIYDISGDAWSSGSSVTCAGNNDMVYLPFHKKVVFSQGNEDAPDPDGGYSIYVINSSGALSTSSQTTPYHWRIKTTLAQYHPVFGDLYLFFSNDDSIRQFDPTADTLTSLGTFTGYAPFSLEATEGGDAGTWGQGVVATTIPDYNVMAFANAQTGEVWLYKPGVPNNLPEALILPTVEDEKDTYDLWEWDYGNDTEPGNVTEVISAGYPDITAWDVHNDTEADDLWTYLHAYLRGGSNIYLERAKKWAIYMRDYYQPDLESDCDGLCHMYGSGLVDWYYYTGNASYLTAAEGLAQLVYNRYESDTPGSKNMSYWGIRGGARHLLVAARVAEATSSSTWDTLLDKMIDLWIQSPSWDNTRKMYYTSEEQQDTHYLYSGSWDDGWRVNSAFQIGILAEALWQARRITGDASRAYSIRGRLIDMAEYVYDYGQSSTHGYTGSKFGLNPSMEKWHNNDGGSGCDRAYSTSLVNLLVMGYKLTGDSKYLTKAKSHLNRGTKGVYDSCTPVTPDDEVDHFLDTVWASADSYLLFEYNKGELQYAYMIFENGGVPTVEQGSRVVMGLTLQGSIMLQ